MKKTLIIAFILAFVLICGKAQAAEKINSLDTDIIINKDSSISVTEKIIYDFGDAEKHGIYKDIPVKYSGHGGNYNLRISNISVTDENGNLYEFSTSRQGRNLNVKIGNANMTVTGIKHYYISYKIDRAINYFQDHDELYWNAVGGEWTVSVEKAGAVITIPSSMAQSEVRLACYYGDAGTSDQCASQKLETGANQSQAVFGSLTVEPGQNFTVVVGIPKGIVIRPALSKRIAETVNDNLIAFLPLAVVAILFFLWRKRGKDPKGMGTIIAQYDSPDRLAPAEVGTIVDEKADPKDLSAEIINLAVRGYLKINKIEEKGLFKKEDYRLDKLQEETDLENEFDRKLMAGIFSGGKSVKISDLKNKFYKDLENIKDLVYEATVKKGYFLKSPKTVRSAYQLSALGVFIAGFFLGGVVGAIGMVSMIASAVIILIFSFFMPKRTMKGVTVKESILGLKLYLSVAEKERLKFHNAPDKNPEQFEMLLPYAIVLGVEKEWAEQFKDIYRRQPAWYGDSTGNVFTALYLSHALSSFNTNSYAALSSHPSSAASGGSGFSGGFSGGGFGGGGGGSW